MIRNLIALAFLLGLYGFVAYTSYGYDDEFSNMRLIETGKSFGEIIATTNSMDVHPPGSYIMNKGLFDLVRDWSIVRLIDALLAALTLWLVWKQSSKLAIHPAFSFLVVCLNPTLLLWTAGLRWYAYYVPLVNLLLLLLIKNPRRAGLFWGMFFGLATILFHFGYISFIIIPALLLIALHLRREYLKTEYRTVLGLSLVSALLCLPQLIVFFTVHLHNSATQISSYKVAAAGLLLHVMAGQGAYPLTVAGISLTIGNGLLFAIGLSRIRASLSGLGSKLFIFGSAGLLLVRLTAKFRNLVVLSVAQGMSQASVFSQIRNRLVKGAVIACFLVGNLWGLYNVVSHHNTTKGSWNMPYAEILDSIRNEAALCHAGTLITIDPGIAYHSRTIVKKVVYLIADKNWAGQIDSAQGCILAFRTFRGSLSEQTYRQYLDFLASQTGHTSKVIQFDRDTNAGFKRRFDADIPDFYAELLIIDKGGTPLGPGFF